MHTHVTTNQRAKDRAALCRMTDEDLMDQFQAGTVEAFNILVNRYSERLEAYLYRFVKDVALCQDMVQETFMRLHRNRHSYRPIAKFSTWLYTIAGNIGRSEYRKRKRRHTYSLETVNRDNETYEIRIPDPSQSPEERTAMGIQMAHIQVALDQLPEAFREVVVLRDVQQLSYADVAEITGLPMGTIKSRINRGRTQIRKMIEKADTFVFDQTVTKNESPGPHRSRKRRNLPAEPVWEMTFPTRLKRRSLAFDWRRVTQPVE